MAVKLHRCSATWVKLRTHPCWAVQKALEEAGIDYEVVKGPLRGSRRDALERLSGQRKYPVIELEDGSAHQADSKEMETRIRAGSLLNDTTQPRQLTRGPNRPKRVSICRASAGPRRACHPAEVEGIEHRA